MVDKDKLRERAEKLMRDLFTSLWTEDDIRTIEATLREYGDERENEALERAADICENPTPDRRYYGIQFQDARYYIAEHIRALKTKLVGKTAQQKELDK